jgi:hypothetical protein
MSAFSPVFAAQISWESNVLGSEVKRLHTDGAQVTIVHGRKGDAVPPHGYSKGAVTYVVSGSIQVDDAILGAGDGGTYVAPGGFYSVKFLEDSTYIVARAANDDITVPDIGERSAHSPDA